MYVKRGSYMCCSLSSNVAVLIFFFILFFLLIIFVINYNAHLGTTESIGKRQIVYSKAQHIIVSRRCQLQSI